MQIKKTTKQETGRKRRPIYSFRKNGGNGIFGPDQHKRDIRYIRNRTKTLAKDLLGIKKPPKKVSSTNKKIRIIMRRRHAERRKRENIALVRIYKKHQAELKGCKTNNEAFRKLSDWLFQEEKVTLSSESIERKLNNLKKQVAVRTRSKTKKAPTKLKTVSPKVLATAKKYSKFRSLSNPALVEEYVKRALIIETAERASEKPPQEALNEMKGIRAVFLVANVNSKRVDDAWFNQHVEKQLMNMRKWIKL